MTAAGVAHTCLAIIGFGLLWRTAQLIEWLLRGGRS